MHFDDAEKLLADLRGLRESGGWRDVLLPEIRRRLDAHQATALNEGSTRKARRRARAGHSELTSLLGFLDSAEDNARTRARQREDIDEPPNS